MRTEIRFVDGDIAVYDQEYEIRMTPLGVEVRGREDDEIVRILFPWTRIARVQQHGEEFGAIYHF